MRVICKNCHSIDMLPHTQNKYIDACSYMCSADCLIDYLKNSKYSIKEHPGESPYLYKDSVDDSSSGDVAYHSDLLGITFRSRYEAQVCECLHKNGILFNYEPYRFLFPHEQGDVTWMPDIYLPTLNIFLEVKGLKGVGFRKKLKCFRRFMPQEVIVVSWNLEPDFDEPFDPVEAFFND